MKNSPALPPRLLLRFFRSFCRASLVDHVEGDLIEIYRRRVDQSGKRSADIKFIFDVFALMRPEIVKSLKRPQLNSNGMYRNYLKVGLRNVIKHKVFSIINVVGLSAGMAVTILIGLWISDEFSFNKYHDNYERIGIVEQHLTYNGQIGTQDGLPYPVGLTLKANFSSDFKYIVQFRGASKTVLSLGDKKFAREGCYMDVDGPEMFSLRMLHGSRDGLKDPSSILLSESVSKSFFNNDNPIGRTIRINDVDVIVTGVYEDIPLNSDLHRLTFIAPWQLHVSIQKLDRLAKYWDWNGWSTYVQIADNADFDKVSEKIKSLNPDKENAYKPVFFINPMSQWHLYSRFVNGVRDGGGIEFVKLFGVTGAFVLLLACINFMNLSTARSEKRAKEVGIRKSIGSQRSQLIGQFFCESLLMTSFAFIVSLCLVQLAFPFFNIVSGKQLGIPWSNTIFWAAGLGFTLATGIVAGSYPAFYLSSFNPLKALKGTFKVGRGASIPRRALVVIQFSVSIILIVGTIVVFRQVQFAKDRPLGFDRQGIIMVEMTNNKIHDHHDAVRAELKASGAIIEMAESSSPVTDVWSTSGDIVWEGKEPGVAGDFPNTRVSQEYGKTVGWEFIEGRDFSPDYATDSAAFILTKSTVDFMRLKNPIGSALKWGDRQFHVIGVINDPVLSPYEALRPSVFHMGNVGTFAIAKLNPAIPVSEAMTKIEKVFIKYNPDVPFDYQFVDQEYEKKFIEEVRVGKLAIFFASLAIFISCLGIFGLASFVAERRTKEIGIRKVLGASVSSLWGMLSKEFVILVALSFIIAVPVSHYFLQGWLMRFDYRTSIGWWIFVLTGVGALTVTMLTVSFQSVRAAMANPVGSLRSE